MLTHDSADLRALEEGRRDMGREIRAIRFADSIAAANAARVRINGSSFKTGSSAVKSGSSPWWTGICAGCGQRLEKLGKGLINLGTKLRDAAEAKQGNVRPSGFQV
ncbi:MAG: hypothetical protein JEY99_04825 [Spirochaetales bacterium]|nr:hypothetical protein [Spirochaetales bacterium]